MALVASGFWLSTSPLLTAVPSDGVAQSQSGSVNENPTREPVTQVALSLSQDAASRDVQTAVATTTPAPPEATPTKAPTPTASAQPTQTPAEAKPEVQSKTADSTPEDGPSSRGGARANAPAPADSIQIAPALFPSLKGQQLEFLLSAIEPARESQRKTGVPASVTLAQAILESDWGRSTVSGAKNFFGIKATRKPGPAGVIHAPTKEFLNGQWVTVTAAFRAYNTMEESFTDHGMFLVENARYAPAFQHKDNPREFARAIHQAGYATDPGYTTKLIRLMDTYELYRFDVK